MSLPPSPSFVANVNAQRYSGVAAISLVIYDIMITMDKEIQHFWGRSFSLVQLMYFLGTYFRTSPMIYVRSIPWEVIQNLIHRAHRRENRQIWRMVWVVDVTSCRRESRHSLSRFLVFRAGLSDDGHIDWIRSEVRRIPTLAFDFLLLSMTLWKSYNDPAIAGRVSMIRRYSLIRVLRAEEDHPECQLRCPFSRFGIFPVGGRSTAIKLSNGDLWVLASTPLDSLTRAKLDELGGRVKYIIGADAVHNLFLPEFKKAYPNAKLLGVPDHLSKPNLKDLKFDGVYGKDPEGTKYGFENEIKSCYFSGFQNQDVAFNHVASRTLIEADLLFNLPATEQVRYYRDFILRCRIKLTAVQKHSKATSSGKVPLIGNLLTPYSWAHKKFVWTAGRDKEAMKRHAQTVNNWDFNRIIPCHGDVIENDGKKAWSEAYKWYLQ
uniref:PGM-like protein n=1 Tax=Inonotus obliquus TaxID=167356 RepID=A0A345BJX6_9AGAM|nr:PGM-like protein [Inonotus obliquus]